MTNEEKRSTLARLLDLIAAGFSRADIACEIGVTRQAIQKMLATSLNGV